jgi:hypothetical protein
MYIYMYVGSNILPTKSKELKSETVSNTPSGPVPVYIASPVPVPMVQTPTPTPLNALLALNLVKDFLS